jgi:hypothetical protein
LQVTFDIQLPLHHKRYVVARLLYGKLVYYDSYISEEMAQVTMERLENAKVIDTKGQ